MQVSNVNDVKIYNLSAGKSLPEWLSDRKKRSLQKRDVDIRRRIQLIQDFSMPTVTDNICVTPDQQYIIATGIYKPKVKCYDVNQLSAKFERGLDSDVVKFRVISEDYSKLIFLQSDRFIEFHNQAGRWYRTRIPAFGHDLSYNPESCDLYVVGASPDVYRVNLECGQFKPPWTSQSSDLSCCAVNSHHQLVACGSSDGVIECFDPRSHKSVASLDCAASFHRGHVVGLPGVSCIQYSDALHMAVGMSTGQVLLFDIRSRNPTMIKDHQYNLPIKDVVFSHTNMERVILSMDTKIIKLWNQSTGATVTSVEPGVDLNALATLPSSGLFFIANESPKIFTYYIPTLGTAPRWCSFLDTLTEEHEEGAGGEGNEEVYEDFKFVTEKELDDLGLTRLKGTNLLRAYMHGYFIDNKLYRKTKALVEPFAYEEYHQKKIKAKLEEERKSRVEAPNKLPEVNKELAAKLIAEESGHSSRKQSSASLLKDNRFSSLFTNPDFELDKESEEFLLAQPLVARLGKDRESKAKKLEETEEVDAKENGGVAAIMDHFEEVQSSSSSSERSTDSESDDEVEVSKQLREQHRQLKRMKQGRMFDDEDVDLKPKFYEVKDEDVDVKSLAKSRPRQGDTTSLASRLLTSSSNNNMKESASGVKEVKFTFKKSYIQRQREESQQHHMQRKQLVRKAGSEFSRKRRGGKMR